ncbi:MAG: Arc family DNA-binding protein [Bacteroidales bacterium]
MAKKKPFVLRLKPEMMEALEKWSADEFRSVNGQIEWIISRALREAGRIKEGNKADNDDAGKDSYE